MKEYDFYIPLFANDGTRISSRKLTRLKKQLTTEFGGLTYFPQQNEGLWKLGRITFRDQIVILRVIVNGSKRTKSTIQRLKSTIKKDWRQADVLIIERSVKAV